MTRLKTNREGKGTGLTPDPTFSLQIPLPTSPPREDEEREKGKASPEGQLCKERWIFLGSRANWLYQPDLFFSEITRVHELLSAQSLSKLPKSRLPKSRSTDRSILHLFPTQSSSRCCVFTHLTGVTSVFPEPTVIFSELWKGEMDAVSHYQYQIHQFFAPIQNSLNSSSRCGLLSSCPLLCTPSPVCPKLYAHSPRFISRQKNFLSRTEIDTVCLQSQAMCNVFLFTTRPRHPWHTSNAHFQVIHCIRICGTAQIIQLGSSQI